MKLTNKFEKGQYLRCIDPGSTYILRTDGVYTCLGTRLRASDGTLMVRVSSDETYGGGGWYLASRFELLVPKYQTVPMHKGKNGIIDIRCDPMHGWQFRDPYYGGWKLFDTKYAGNFPYKKGQIFQWITIYDSKSDLYKRITNSGVSERWRSRGVQGLNGEWGPDTDEPWVYHYQTRKWYRKGIDPEPKKPLTLQALGMSMQAFPACCGAMVLVGFNQNPKEWGESDVIEFLKTHMSTYEGKTTGIVMAICNPTQNPMWQPILEKVGFVLVSQHPNYAHGATHYNWLYHWVCKGHSKSVKEKERSF